MPDMECRVAKLEQRQESLEKSINELKDDHRRKMDKVFEALEKLREIQEKQKGFIGGVIFTVGALFSAVTWFFSSKFSGS